MRLRSFSCYYLVVGIAFFLVGLYTVGIFFGSAANCQAGCPLQIMAPGLECAGADPATMYADRCFQCSDSSKVQWGCPDMIPIPSCSNTPGGTVLDATPCAASARAVSGALSRYGPEAVGVCVEFIATENLAFPSSRSLETLAEAELGPGVLLVTKTEASARQTLLGSACLNSSLARQNLVVEGPMCYNTPLSVSARGLLVPGMAVFVSVFVLQAFITTMLGAMTCVLRE